MGRKGKPAEQVAGEVVKNLTAFHQSQAFLDEHLADQLILPLALSNQAYTFSTPTLSKHTLTNIWVVEQFLGPVTEIDHQNKIVRIDSTHRLDAGR